MRLLLACIWMVFMSSAAPCTSSPLSASIAQGPLELTVDVGFAGLVVFKTYPTLDVSAPVKLSGSFLHAAGDFVPTLEVAIQSKTAAIVFKGPDTTTTPAPDGGTLSAASRVGAPSTMLAAGVVAGLCALDARSPLALLGLSAAALVPLTGAECAPSVKLTVELPSSRSNLFSVSVSGSGRGDGLVTGVSCAGVACDTCTGSRGDHCVVAPPTMATAAPSLPPTTRVPTKPGETFVPTASPTPIVFPWTVPEGLATLPSSQEGTLLILKRIFAGSEVPEIPVARSYDGLAWEGILPSPVVPHDGNKLSVSSEEVYRVDSMVMPPGAAGSAEAKFLEQTTFGPSRASLADLKATAPHGDLAKWLDKQVKLPMTSHRAYARQRTNPRSAVTWAQGSVRTACQVESRWHTFVFNTKDKTKPVVVTPNYQGRGKWAFEVDGELFGEVDTFEGSPPLANSTQQSFVVCAVEEEIGGVVQLGTQDLGCTKASNPDLITMTNPAIFFTQAVPGTTQSFQASDLTMTPLSSAPNSFILEKANNCKGPGRSGVSFFSSGGTVYKHDPRLKWVDNTVENPLSEQLEGASCPAVVKSFLNAEGCARRQSCAPIAYTSVDMVLDDATVRSWYEAPEHRYVYVLRGLRLTGPYEVSPCNGKVSRWIKTAGACASPTGLDANTIASISTALGAKETSSIVKDIIIDGSCTAELNGVSATGASITVTASGTAECWTHSHPQEYGVFDATYWSIIHDGNKIAMQNNRPNPIERWAKNGDTTLVFPSHHKMDQWKDRVGNLVQIGNFGDTIDFATLPTELQTSDMAVRVGAGTAEPASDAFEVCGSPFEVRNVPALGNLYHLDNTLVSEDNGNLDVPHTLSQANEMAWQNVVLKSEDQLRQRAAWSLAQIITLGEEGLGRNEEVECWAAYYDIFVRNAFGNFRDVLREVTYSPMMATYLTYKGNKAFFPLRTFPDENYAREIMQLFSIGLWKLNPDGTQILDEKGEPIATYDNDDVVAFARLFTGFDHQPNRGNNHKPNGKNAPNIFDPLQIKPSLRDVFPKTKLDAGYLGDGYPLCSDLPARHWTAKGARFIYTGKHSLEGSQVDDSNIANRPRFEPSNSTSQLYDALCQKSAAGRCTFALDEVVLAANLPCDGKECGAEMLRVVKIVDGDNFGYFTYTPPPCVRLALFDDNEGRVVKGVNQARQCAPKSMPVAAPTCCRTTDGKQSTKYYDAICLFIVENTKYETASARCEAVGLQLCQPEKHTSNPTWAHSCLQYGFQWVNQTCGLQVQVHSEGQINIVDDGNSEERYQVNGGNTFKVRWRDNNWPTSEACGSSGCITALAGTCLCNISVSESAVFTDASVVPSPDEIVDALHIGASAVSSFSDGTYEVCVTAACKKAEDSTGVAVFTLVASNGAFDAGTVFRLRPLHAGQPPRWLLNKASIVSVGSGGLSFRNPPSFMPMVGEVMRKSSWQTEQMMAPAAHHEVEALLDHLFYHPNTAPFVVYRLIQRLVTSNPSPRYVRACVEAFKTGKTRDRLFSGEYGDLQATIYAILLDPEARSRTLDLDPTHGRLREPLLKVLHFVRAMEYTPSRGREVLLRYMDDRIGQMAYNSPSVFGFYPPEFEPAGRLQDANLVSPEAQLGTAPLLVGYLNGMSSLVDYGLTNCYKGFGDSLARPRRSCGRSNNYELTKATADGQLAFVPSSSTPSGVVDELAALLTAGRLSETSRHAIIEAMEAKSSPEAALAVAQKLLITTPEFHATNINLPTGGVRKPPSTSNFMGRPYKAIVVVFMNGGCDSYSMLVPHSNCKDKDLYAEYETVRTNAAIPKADLHPINVPSGTQPCDTFGLHPTMPHLQKLYDQGDAAFFANIGALVEPVTKPEYQKQSKRLPPSLFAHNIQQRCLQNVHAQNANAKGVVGRIVDEINKRDDPLKVNMYSIVGNNKILEANSQGPSIIDKNSGVERWMDYATLETFVANISQPKCSSAFADTFSSLLDQSLRSTEELGGILEQAHLDVTFKTDDLGTQFDKVSKLIKLRGELKSERDVFLTMLGGFDTHNTFELPGLGYINDALESFETEMKSQGVWEDVVVVTVSDFARTLTSNGLGTDHAWGGNMFAVGGSVKGGQVLGKYPMGFTDQADTSIGRGRVMPTTSWEAMWQPLAQWFGVEENELAAVLPNAINFPPEQLFGREALFEN